MIGREQESRKIEEIMLSQRAELVAVYGRRRVGKTFLIKETAVRSATRALVVTGKKGGNKTHQLELFQTEVEKVMFDGGRLPKFKNWEDAFHQLLVGMLLFVKKSKKSTIVIFLDELPWLATTRGGLLETIDHFWNTKLQYLPQLKFFICGSAASWIINNIINSKGGLHNRLTATIQLRPFNLEETRLFLAQKKFAAKSLHNLALEVYLIFGGIPHYLSLLRASESISQNISRLCFGGGELAAEQRNLYKALFDNDKLHRKITTALGQRPEGMTREELLKKISEQSSGTISEVLEELEQAGFISTVTPYGAKERGVLYLLTDEFSAFAVKWLAKKHSLMGLAADDGGWSQLSQTQQYKIWRGNAFEKVCLKHFRQIQHALGFAQVSCWVGPVRFKEKGRAEVEGRKGLQIDLLFDRADGVITLVEIKYYDGTLNVDKKLATELENKRAYFIAQSQTKKNVTLALLAKDGVAHNNLLRNLSCTTISSAVLFTSVAS